MEIVELVRVLNLPKKSCVVVGSGPLHVAGLRPAHDVDLIVVPEVFMALSLQRGWRISRHDSSGDDRLQKGLFDVSMCWPIGERRLTTQHLLCDATWVKGVAFANLRQVLAWKLHARRSKDLDDINAIKQYLQSDRRAPNPHMQQYLSSLPRASKRFFAVGAHSQ